MEKEGNLKILDCEFYSAAEERSLPFNSLFFCRLVFSSSSNV